MNPEDVIIEPVHGARWVIAWHPDSTFMAVAPETPPYASPQLREARRDRLAAVVLGRCRHCGAVDESLTDLQAASPCQARDGSTVLSHRPGCPRSQQAADEVERACSPFGTLERADTSEETMTRVVVRYLQVREIVNRRAAITQSNRPEGGTHAHP